MVDFPGFEAHPVDLPDAAEMPPHADTGGSSAGDPVLASAGRASPSPTSCWPYTGVTDGRVLVWDGARWAYFAHASPTPPQIAADDLLSYPHHTGDLFCSSPTVDIPPPFSFSTGCSEGSRTPASASAGTRPTRSASAAAAAASTSRRAPAPRAATPPPASASDLQA
ncbi:hypothetical protein ZWY2020_046259 [Hordeum vulgare]|nr:hypothetical protein ZWY2020_046259 [Hordeum vulgare]